MVGFFFQAEDGIRDLVRSRGLGDVYKRQVQDEIATAIVNKLKIELAPREQQLAQRDAAPTENVEAYEFYLQARAIWKRRGEDNLRLSLIHI